MKELTLYYEALAESLSQNNRSSLLSMLSELSDKAELVIDDTMPIRLSSANATLANWQYLYKNVLGYDEATSYTSIIPSSYQLELLMLFKQHLEKHDKSKKDNQSYYFNNGTLQIGNNSIHFTKGSRRYELLTLLLKSSSNTKRNWNIDQIAEKIDGHDYILNEDYKNRFYQMCDAINKRTGRNFLVFDTNHVQINPAYTLQFLS